MQLCPISLCNKHAIGYFVSPIDAIPDIVPVAGYTDDLGVLVLALVSVALLNAGDIYIIPYYRTQWSSTVLVIHP